MSKRFSRNIFPGDGTKEPLDTNRVGDFLVSSKESDTRYGKGDAWIRKEGGYHCLTDNIKSLTSDLADIVGITSTGKNSRRLKVNPEILTNDKVQASGLIQKTDRGNDGITLGLGIETIADGLSELNRFLEIDSESLEEIAENGEVDEYIRLRNKDHVFNVPTYKYVKGLAGNAGGSGEINLPDNLVTIDMIGNGEISYLDEITADANLLLDEKYFNYTERNNKGFITFNPNIVDKLNRTSGTENTFENLEFESISQDGYSLIENPEDVGYDENKFYFNTYNGLINSIVNNGKIVGLNVKPQKFMEKSYGDLRGYFAENLHYDEKYFHSQEVFYDEDEEGVRHVQGEYLTLNEDFLKSLKQSGEGSLPNNVLTSDDIGDGNGAELVSRTNIGANFSHIKTINVYENTEITYTQRNVFNNGEAWIRTIEKPDNFYTKLKGETDQDNLFIEESHILMSRFVINYHAIDHYRENQVELNLPIENGGDMSINEGVVSLVTPNLEENTIEVKNYIVNDSYAHKQLLSFYSDDRNLITTFDKERHPMVSNYILSRFDVEKTLEGNSENNE